MQCVVRFESAICFNLQLVLSKHGDFLSPFVDRNASTAEQFAEFVYAAAGGYGFFRFHEMILTKLYKFCLVRLSKFTLIFPLAVYS
ncbi:hypothetical protein BEH71_20750 [Citrobacter freundii]|nr:hypothetical protein BEH71_20750 [Citrobacter freundii]